MEFVKKQESSDVLKWTIDITRQAGEHALEYFGSLLTKHIKGHPNDYATEADIAIEKFIVSHIQERFPGDAILAEEGGWYGVADAEHVWIIDPIDGTSNFANTIPEYGVMVARAKKESVDLSVVYNPTQKMMAWAQKGNGAFFNGERVIAPVPPSSFDRLRVIIASSYSAQHRSRIQKMRAHSAVFASTCSYRAAASNMLHMLSNEQDVWMVNTMKPWDTAPTSLILQEAGYMMTTVVGDPYFWQGDDQSVLAAHPSIHPLIEAYIKEMTA